MDEKERRVRRCKEEREEVMSKGLFILSFFPFPERHTKSNTKYQRTCATLVPIHPPSFFCQLRLSVSLYLSPRSLSLVTVTALHGEKDPSLGDTVRV